MNRRSAASAAVLLGAACGAMFSVSLSWAQQSPIERIRITDNELSCAQLHAETLEMDKIAAEARAAEGQGNTTALAGTAGNVAAEVAGRTGLFGQLGGLTGALFGQVAAKTAAGAAQQSGQSTAQQAAERAKQAGARKEHVSALFLNKGCKASDLSYNPPAPAPGAAPVVAAPVQLASAAGSTAAAIAPPAPVTALPNVNPDEYFAGKTGGTFGKNIVEVLPANRRVAVMGFRVAFVTSNTVTATVRGSYLPGRDTSGASQTLTVTLSGVDNATMQTLTDRTYADFLAQLKLAGREVVPQEELKEFLAGLDVTPTAPGKPYSKESNGQTAVAFSPTGMPLWFHNGDAPWGDKSPFEQKNYRSTAEYSQKLNAIVIAPLLVVNFARMSSSGNRSAFTASAAETAATLSMHVARLATHLIRSEETRSGLTMKGDEGSVAQSKVFASDLPFGTMKEVASSDNSATKGVFDALGRAAGLANAGGAARGKSENVAETNNAAFAAAAGDALARATGTFAKLFEKHAAK